MKTALLLYGQPRNFRNAYFQNFNTFYKNNEVDIFLHSWFNSEDVGKHFKASAGQDGGKIESDLEKKLVELYKPKRYRVDRQMEFDVSGIHMDKSHPCEHSNFLFGNCSSTYSLKQVGQLFLEYCHQYEQSYDLVVVTRFDYCFYEPIDLSTLNPNVMNTIDVGLGLTFALCDQFYASNMENMRKLFGLHHFMFEQYKDVGIFNAERNAFSLMEKNRIPMNLIKYDSRIFGRA